MTAATITLLVLAAGTYTLKAIGPLALGGDRQLPPMVERLALLLPAPLLAALVASATLVDDQRWVLDARVVGLAAAAVALWRRLPFVVVVVAAAAATAAARALAAAV
ncbi:MAG: AzlD domain-containing protein [Acidimicrobiales bacterium]